MANKKLWLGILVMVLVFGMAVVGCDDNGGNDTTANLSITITNNSNYTINAYKICLAVGHEDNYQWYPVNIPPSQTSELLPHTVSPDIEWPDGTKLYSIHVYVRTENTSMSDPHKGELIWYYFRKHIIQPPNFMSLTYPMSINGRWSNTKENTGVTYLLDISGNNYVLRQWGSGEIQQYISKGTFTVDNISASFYSMGGVLFTIDQTHSFNSDSEQFEEDQSTENGNIWCTPEPNDGYGVISIYLNGFSIFPVNGTWRLH